MLYVLGAIFFVACILFFSIALWRENRRVKHEEELARSWDREQERQRQMRGGQ